MMHQLVDNIIAPYFEATKRELGLPPSQMSIWKIDCWSVHKSKEFLAWMKEHHPTITILFIPGGCTGLWQPLDVGIQRLLKLSMKRSAHRDLVEEATQQIKAGKATHEIRLDTTMRTLRNRSVGWIVQAIEDVGDSAIITRVRGTCFLFQFRPNEDITGLRDVSRWTLEPFSGFTHVARSSRRSSQSSYHQSGPPRRSHAVRDGSHLGGT
jgi:hypothetical protein